MSALAAGVRRPAYDREALEVGIVHLGLGAFVRAHLAAITDDAIEAAAGAGLGWGICGVSMRAAATRDALAPQQGLYTVAERDAQGLRLRVVGCVRECLVAPEDPAAVVARIAAPATRIVSLTITEKGYADEASGALRLIVDGLAARRAAGAGGLSLLSLDNLAANGRVLRAALLQHAQRQDEALAGWIASACRFPCSMVDRIVPRTTAADRDAVAEALGADDAWPVLAEPFLDWAVEDDFAAGRPDWAAGGARFVADAAPWETLKLRSVNGCHSALAYLGLLAGWATVDEALAQPPLARWLRALLREEIVPTLPPLPGVDVAAYGERLLARFANPGLAHRTAQIAADGSLKLPLRWAPVLRDNLAAGRPVARLALAVAAWWRCWGGADEAGRPLVLDDPRADELRRHQRAAPAGELAQARHLLAYAPVFGDLAAQAPLAEAVAAALRRLREAGVRATLESMP